ncbi:hypothetical protein BK026_14795 [Alteromonas sp. V450]|nr:hypothetical protein BK026_14795 [Alteromonas sp. V450]
MKRQNSVFDERSGALLSKQTQYDTFFKISVDVSAHFPIIEQYLCSLTIWKADINSNQSKLSN